MSTLTRYALTIGAAAVLLPACGAWQPSTGAPNAINAPLLRPTLPRPLVTARERVRGGLAYSVTKPLLYVTNYTANYNDVKVYHARDRSPSPVQTITAGIDSPIGDCLGADGTLYVTNEPADGPGWVSEYSYGQTQPLKTITKGIGSPAFCAIDAKGDLWVTNLSGPNVTEYRKGSTRPYSIITNGMVYPIGIAIDHFGNMYVSNGSGGSTLNVQVYSQGSKSPSRTITDGVTSPAGVAVDANGTLYVTNYLQNNVEEYRLGKSHPYRTITEALDDPVAVTANKKGWLYVSNYANNVVVEFAPGSVTPSRRRISKGLYTPEGSAYFPPLLP